MDHDAIERRAEARRQRSRRRERKRPRRAATARDRPRKAKKRKQRSKPPRPRRPLEGVDLEVLAQRLDLSLDDGEERQRIAHVVHRFLPRAIDNAADYERRQSKKTVLAFGLHAIVGALVALAALVSPTAASRFTGYFGLTGLIAVIALMGWLWTTYDHEDVFGFRPPRYAGSQVVWAFFNPLVAWIRPYRLLVYLHRASDPDQLPLVPRRLAATSVATYRRAPRAAHEHRRAPDDMRFPVGLFWLVYLVSESIGYAALPPAVHGAVIAVAGALGIHVVRAIDRRRAELLRRMADLLREAEALANE